MHINKKIFFVLPSLCCGGAERVVSTLVKYMNKKGNNIAVVLFEKRGELLDEIPKNVYIFDLKKRSRFSFLKLVYNLSKIINNYQPDVVVSFLEYANLVTMLSKNLVKKNKIRWIISERSLPSLSFSDMRFYHIKVLLHKMLDKSADIIIVNSLQTKEELIKKFNIPEEKIRYISNPIDTKTIIEMGRQKPQHLWYTTKVPVVVSVGRLSKSKGYTYLILAFKNVLETTQAKLIILGEGEERKNLEHLIEKLNLKTYVELVGYVKNPYPYIAHADIFVLSSLWEGMPNVLLEAVVLGKAVIATKCNSSVEEIIKNGVNGILVEPGDINLLGEAIKKLLEEPELRVKFEKENLKKASEFDLEKIVPQYEQVFLE